MGILYLDLMNIVSLPKWWWKFKNTTYNSLWKTNITISHTQFNNFPTSPFWKAVLQIKPIVDCSSTLLVARVQCLFGKIFGTSNALQLYPDISLHEVLTTQGDTLTFKRILHEIDMRDWTEILTLIHTLYPTHTNDHLSWRWWKLKLPPKIKVFMWLVHKKTILTKSNLIHRGCQFWGEIETIDHLFIQCPLVRQVWFRLGQVQ